MKLNTFLASNIAILYLIIQNPKLSNAKNKTIDANIIILFKNVNDYINYIDLSRNLSEIQNKLTKYLKTNEVTNDINHKTTNDYFIDINCVKKY